jgi:hypothetical protein
MQATLLYQKTAASSITCNKSWNRPQTPQGLQSSFSPFLVVPSNIPPYGEVQILSDQKKSCLWRKDPSRKIVKDGISIARLWSLQLDFNVWTLGVPSSEFSALHFPRVIALEAFFNLLF